MAQVKDNMPLSFVIVGSGWRSEFYVRIAKQYPEQFNLKYMLCRSQEKADKMAAKYDMPRISWETLMRCICPWHMIIMVSV